MPSPHFKEPLSDLVKAPAICSAYSASRGAFDVSPHGRQSDSQAGPELFPPTTFSRFRISFGQGTVLGAEAYWAVKAGPTRG